MENKLENNMEHDMTTRVLWWFIGIVVCEAYMIPPFPESLDA